MDDPDVRTSPISMIPGACSGYEPPETAPGSRRHPATSMRGPNRPGGAGAVMGLQLGVFCGIVSLP